MDKCTNCPLAKELAALRYELRRINEQVLHG